MKQLDSKRLYIKLFSFLRRPFCTFKVFIRYMKVPQFASLLEWEVSSRLWSFFPPVKFFSSGSYVIDSLDPNRKKLPKNWNFNTDFGILIFFQIDIYHSLKVSYRSKVLIFTAWSSRFREINTRTSQMRSRQWAYIWI